MRIKKLTSLKETILGKEDLFLYLMFFLVLGLQVFFSSVGWNNTLYEHHGFRQTQTAISTYYMLKEGFKINYLTPIFGKPWSIPLEFPLYQWIVAAVVRLTHMNLDQAGRAVSLAFFYLALISFYRFLGYFTLRRDYRFIFLTLLLANPIYIFFSRTFMIESLALFLAIAFLVRVLKAATTLKFSDIVTGAFIGSLAGLVKITTFTIFFFPAAFLFFYYAAMPEQKEKFKPRFFRKKIIPAVVLLGIPLCMTLAWTLWADHQRSLNPLANGALTSDLWRHWNFGTIGQRFALKSWTTLGKTIVYSFGVTNSAIILGLTITSIFLLLKTHNYLRETLGCLAFSLTGPLLFFNLYYVHDYYWYANIICLLSCLGFLMMAVLERNKYLGYLFILAVLMGSYHGYGKLYYNIQKTNDLSLQPLCTAIKNFTREKDVLLIYGDLYSSEIPYYCERRAVMDQERNVALTGKRFQKILQNLGADTITAMVIKRETDQYIPLAVNDVITKYRTSEEALRQKLRREPTRVDLNQYFRIPPQEMNQIESLISFERSFVGKVLKDNEDFIQERIDAFHLLPQPVYRDRNFELYVVDPDK